VGVKAQNVSKNSDQLNCWQPKYRSFFERWLKFHQPIFAAVARWCLVTPAATTPSFHLESAGFVAHIAGQDLENRQVVAGCVFWSIVAKRRRTEARHFT
jgi:hypothetical protein